MGGVPIASGTFCMISISYGIPSLSPWYASVDLCSYVIYIYIHIYIYYTPDPYVVLPHPNVGFLACLDVLRVRPAGNLQGGIQALLVVKARYYFKGLLQTGYTAI